MSELPAITTAPAPGPNFIQIYTKLSTKAISLGFWGADLATQRLHDIDSSANDALTVTTPQSQITDVEFYGATTVLGFVPQTGHTRHTLAFLSPAFKVLPETKTTVPIACTGLAGANTPGAQASSYVYFLSPSTTPTSANIKEYDLKTQIVTNLPAAFTPTVSSPLAAYYHSGGPGKTPTSPLVGTGRYVIYIDADKASIKEALVSTQIASKPVTIVSGAKFHPQTGLAVVFVPANKRTYLYYTGADLKLMRIVKKPNDMNWDTTPIPVPADKVNHHEVQVGAQLTAVLQKSNIHIFWPLSSDVNGLGHGYDDI